IFPPISDNALLGLLGRFTNSMEVVYAPGASILVGSLGEDTFTAPGGYLSPSASFGVMTGHIGSDTYEFGPWLNGGVVFEVPDFAGTGSTLLFGMDTLDLSKVFVDLVFDVYPLHGNTGLFESILEAKGQQLDANDPRIVGYTFVTVSPALGGGKSPIPFIIANGIDSLEGGHGKNTFVLHDGATLRGGVSSSLGGT
ncbi:MAG: hypothetical protein GY869_32360, partial [Planctomycetes bacterium]|nr:hypothetical protein [Planctomycetota bacterium]